MRTPDDDASELDWLLFTQRNLITARQAARLLSPSAVRHRLAAGRWRRVCRGVLITHPGPLTRGQHLWVAVLSVRGATLAGVGAAQESGLRGFRREPIDVLVPGGHTTATAIRRLDPDLPGVRVHRTGSLPREHWQRGHPPRTTIERSAPAASSRPAGAPYRRLRPDPLPGRLLARVPPAR